MNYLKILISANDVGSALQNIAIINFCELQEINVSFYIISSHLTSHIFDNSGFPVKLISNKCTDKKKIIQNIFKEFKPDFVLAGLSFCNEAIDDIVIEISSELAITNGVIQDYWGYIGNFSNNLLPDFFFVIDKLSVYLTKKKTNGKADCIITGSPKHQMYKIMNFSIKNNKRKKPYLIFIGQPREIPGFIYNLKAFINTLNNFDHKIDIGFKPHPIDYQLENYYIDLFQEQPNPFIIIPPQKKLESYIAQADLVVNCFSTAGLDHNYMQLYSEKNLGNLLYLNIGDDILRYINEQVGIPAIPGSLYGMGKTVVKEDSILDEIQTGLYDIDLREKYKQSVIENLNTKDLPCETIMNHIQNLF